MGKTRQRFITGFCWIIILMGTSCSVQPSVHSVLTSTPFQPESVSTEVAQPPSERIYFSAVLPQEWQHSLSSLAGTEIVGSDHEADFIFQPSTMKDDEGAVFSAERIYAAVVPFFTVEDGITAEELKACWQGQLEGGEQRKIYISPEAYKLWSVLWGEPGINVITNNPEDLLEQVENSEHALAIVPFEELEPHWKVLKIDGVSPLDKPLQVSSYPLTAYFHLVSRNPESSQDNQLKSLMAGVIPTTNRDESKMTVLIMSGTTAITRGLAYKIRINSADYPVDAIKDWFLTADLRHVSNESPFVKDCPEPDPYTSSLIFCSSLEDIEVLEKIGINVVELTGNHVDDYGAENLISTIKMYQDRGWGYFGGGLDADDARSPYLTEHNGNKIAFIGCNPVGPNSVWAKEGHAGAAQCDFDYLTKKIRELKEQGYIVIATFQHEELTKQDGAEAVLMYAEKISGDFQALAAAGADIVQGSQAHYPMGFEFYGSSLIHYGLGNFLFDQMWEPNRNEFIDRHILYDGKYISTELKTAILMDWSRPTPMTAEEREQFLNSIFKASLQRMK